MATTTSETSSGLSSIKCEIDKVGGGKVDRILRGDGRHVEGDDGIQSELICLTDVVGPVLYERFRLDADSNRRSRI